MNLLSIRYFLAVAQKRSFTAAADMLHVSQPALSHHIRILEGTLGVKLLIRSTRSVELTDDGQYLVECLLPSFNHIDNVVSGIMRGHRQPTVFRIATVPSAASLYLPSILTRLQSDAARVEVEVQESTSWAIMGIVKAKQAHVGLIRSGDAGSPQLLDEHCCSLNFPKHRLMIVVSMQHPLAHRQTACLQEFGGDYFLHYDRATAPGLSALVDQGCAQSGLTPKVLCVGSELLTIGKLVADNFGVALLPADMYGLIQPLRVKAISLTDVHLSSWITAIWERTAYLGSNTQRLVDILEILRQEDAHH